MNGNDIRRWRSVNRVKQEALAAMVGVSKVAVSKWESGHTRPSKTVALRLAEVMSGLHEGKLAIEIACTAPQQQRKVLIRGKKLQLVGISAGYREAWPEMTDFVGSDLRPYAMNEALFCCDDSGYLRDADRGEILMVTGVSNRLLDIGGPVPPDQLFRWHAVARRIDGELIHEVLFEHCAPGTTTGIEKVLRQTEIALAYD